VGIISIILCIFLPLEGYCLDTNCPLIGNSNSIVWECNERSVEICLLKFDTIEILFIERAVGSP
jgi:hypothetical protein